MLLLGLWTRIGTKAMRRNGMLNMIMPADYVRRHDAIAPWSAIARHDPIAPPVLGKDLATRIGGARYVEFDSASHALPIQLADEVNALLADHLCSAEQSGAPATLS